MHVTDSLANLSAHLSATHKPEENFIFSDTQLFSGISHSGLSAEGGGRLSETRLSNRSQEKSRTDCFNFLKLSRSFSATDRWISTILINVLRNLNLLVPSGHDLLSPIRALKRSRCARAGSLRFVVNGVELHTSCGHCRASQERANGKSFLSNLVYKSGRIK